MRPSHWLIRTGLHLTSSDPWAGDLPFDHFPSLSHHCPLSCSILKIHPWFLSFPRVHSLFILSTLSIILTCPLYYLSHCHSFFSWSSLSPYYLLSETTTGIKGCHFLNGRPWFWSHVNNWMQQQFWIMAKVSKTLGYHETVVKNIYCLEIGENIARVDNFWITKFISL